MSARADMVVRDQERLGWARLWQASSFQSGIKRYTVIKYIYFGFTAETYVIESETCILEVTEASCMC